jgi:hypothetical protein
MAEPAGVSTSGSAIRLGATHLVEDYSESPLRDFCRASSRSKASAFESNSSAHKPSCSLAGLVRAARISSRQRAAKFRSKSAFIPLGSVVQESIKVRDPRLASSD